VRAADRQPPFPGIQIFATLRNTFDEAFMADVLRGMPQVGVDVITANTEYGPGQMEINFAPALGIAAADQAFTFKNGIKGDRPPPRLPGVVHDQAVRRPERLRLPPA
jgi:glutamine synthetase